MKFIIYFIFSLTASVDSWSRNKVEKQVTKDPDKPGRRAGVLEGWKGGGNKKGFLGLKILLYHQSYINISLNFTYHIIVMI